MAVSYPLTTFFDDRLWITTQFYLPARQTLSRARSGELYGIDIGEPIWSAAFTSPPLTLDECVEIEADLIGLDGVLQSFLGHDTRRAFPRQYPTGSFSDSAVIASIGTGRRSITLSGAPANFAIKKGDRFSVQRGDGKWSLHVATEDETANGSGATSAFDIRPRLHNSLSVGDAVRFKKPPANFVVQPDTVTFSDGASALGTVTFSAIQDIS